MATNTDDRKIMIAVDFGTTYSGMAWAHTRKPETQTTIIQWPDAVSGNLEGATSDKVPTELQYLGQDYKWGFQIPEYGKRHCWFKLDLDPTHRPPMTGLARDFQDHSNAALPDYDHNPEKLVTDYLTALRKHAEKVLAHKLPQSVLANIPVEYILTVPALWSDTAQAKTRSCAEKAGMGSGSSLHIISEPEAGATYALDTMDPHGILIGDTFVVCDAGGGTVDLISYKVSALKPVLQIVEAAPGSGSSCGSSFLNRVFANHMKNKLGKLKAWDEEVLEEAMAKFDSSIKRSFGGRNDEEHWVPVPGMKDNMKHGIRRGKMRLTGTEVRTIFEPVVKDILGLVKGQIEATNTQVKAVLMVGGFGQNAYLRERIREAIKGDNIEVMQSPNGWTSVVRGALMKGLSSTNPSYEAVKVTQRSARKHYGVRKTLTHNLSVHSLTRRRWNDFHGEWRITVMDWFVKKGELVEEAKPKRLEYHQRELVEDGRPSIFEVQVYACSDSGSLEPPMYCDGKQRSPRIVTIKADLSRVPVSKFTQAVGRDGKPYYVIEYAIDVTYMSAYTKYELIHDNVNYGLVVAEYV